MEISMQDDMLRKIKKIIYETTCKSGSIYIYGCGSTAMIFCNLLRSQGIEFDNIAAFVVDDAYFEKSDKEINGIDVVCFSEFIEKKHKNDFIYYTIDSYESFCELKNKLSQENINAQWVTFQLDRYRRGLGTNYEFWKKHEDEMDRVYELLSDEKSKKLFHSYIYACVSGDYSRFFETDITEQYFNSATRSTDVKSVVDCGAYVGDSIIEAFSFYGADQLDTIYAFEPDDNNRNMLVEEVSRRGCDVSKIVLMENGTWSRKDILSFSINGDGSTINSEGEVLIKVDALDDMLVGKRIDYIKMDIEGSELESLKGAETIIKEQTPILAVCIYHKRDDDSCNIRTTFLKHADKILETFGQDS